MQPQRLMDRVREAIRVRHYSYRTEQTYLQWIRRYILFNNKRHPTEMGKTEVTAFLSHLATQRDVSASTQNQDLSAILFLYRHVLEQELEWLDDVVRAKRSTYLPTVLDRDQVQNLFLHLSGVHKLVSQLMYGTGLRLMEALRFRVGDLDFSYGQIVVRSGKGAKDRITMLPKSLFPALRSQLELARSLHSQDLLAGFGAVHLPSALAIRFPIPDPLGRSPDGPDWKASSV